MAEGLSANDGAAAPPPGQAMLDAQTVQAQVEALLKSQFGPSSGDTAMLFPSEPLPVSRVSPGNQKQGEAPPQTKVASSASLAPNVSSASAPGSRVEESSLPSKTASTLGHEGQQGTGPKRGAKRTRDDEGRRHNKSQKLHIQDEDTVRLLQELEAVANSYSANANAEVPAAPSLQGASAGVAVPPADAGTPSAATTPSQAHSFQNTFAQYQYPQDNHLAFKEAVRAASVEASKFPGSQGASETPANGKGTPRETSTVMTREEEERAADALMQDIDAVQAAAEQPATASTGATAAEVERKGAEAAVAAQALTSVDDLAAVMGLDENGEPLPGNEESHRALAEAVKRLNAQHEQAVKQATSAAASKAAAAQALHSDGSGSKNTAVGSNTNAGTTPATAAPVAPAPSVGKGLSDTYSPSPSHADSQAAKRFQCPKCDRAFARAFNLNTHLSTHDPDPNRSKPYPCPYPSCKSEGGRAFSRKHDLQRHVASVHEFEPEPGINGDPGEVPGDTGGLASLGLGTPGKRFRCDGCGRSFVRRDARNRHQCNRRRDSKHDDGSSAGVSSANSPTATPAPTAAPAAATSKDSSAIAAAKAHAREPPREPPREPARENLKPATGLVSGLSLYHSGPAKDAASAKPGSAASSRGPTPAASIGPSSSNGRPSPAPAGANGPQRQATSGATSSPAAAALQASKSAAPAQPAKPQTQAPAQPKPASARAPASSAPPSTASAARAAAAVPPPLSSAASSSESSPASVATAPTSISSDAATQTTTVPHTGQQLASKAAKAVSTGTARAVPAAIAVSAVEAGGVKQEAPITAATSESAGAASSAARIASAATSGSALVSASTATPSSATATANGSTATGGSASRS